jgi:hypothetical protein
MAKSTFNLQASNSGFGPRSQGATAAPRVDRVVHSGGPHFAPKSDDAKQAAGDRAADAATITRRRTRPFRAFSVTATLATLLVAAFWISRPWQRQSLAERWRRDLHEAGDAIALARVHQLGQLGPPGARVLGGAIGIAREDIARAARAEVTSQLAQWELMDAKRSSPLIVALAQGMAESIEAFDRDARRFAGDAAQRMLVWPVDRGTTNRAPLIAACETVLLSVGRPAAPPRAARPTPAVQSTPAEPTLAAEPSPAEARRLPSSVEVAPLARVPTEATVEVSDEATREQPPDNKSPPSDSKPEPDEPQAAPLELSRAVTRVERAVADANDEVDHSRRDISSQHATWMRDLNSEHDDVVAAARNELSKLGLSGDELKIARLATHPDAPVRQRLARALPRLPGIDGRTWLEFLADDPDDEVRRTARTLLATTGDPESVSRLRERR